MKKYLRISIEVVFGLYLGVILSVSLIAQEVEPELLTIFQNKDNLQLLVTKNSNRKAIRGFEVSFTIKEGSLFDPAQGAEITDYTIAWTANWWVVKGIHNYEHLPVYRSPGESVYQRGRDYDKEGNLIIWRTLETYILSTKDRKEKIEKLMSYEISPDGDIKKSPSPYTIHSLYRGGSPPKIFEHFRLATGRGFAKHFTKPTSKKTTVLPSGQRIVDIYGDRGLFKGKWTIKYEPSSDYLIREGRFFVDNQESPLVSVTNSGLVKCPGLSIAESGVYSYGDDQREFRVIYLKSFERSQSEGHPLYKEIIEQVTAPLPKERSDIIDYRGKKPRLLR